MIDCRIKIDSSAYIWNWSSCFLEWANNSRSRISIPIFSIFLRGSCVTNSAFQSTLLLWKQILLFAIRILKSLTCPVASIRKVCSKRPRFVRGLPLSTWTIIIVRVYVVIVHVHPRQKRGPGRTAHGRCDIGMSELSTLVSYCSQCFWHKIEWTELDVLVVRENQNYVRFAFPRGGYGCQQWGFPTSHPITQKSEVQMLWNTQIQKCFLFCIWNFAPNKEKKCTYLRCCPKTLSAVAIDRITTAKRRPDWERGIVILEDVIRISLRHRELFKMAVDVAVLWI